MKYFYLRALGITTVKNLLFIIVNVAVLMTIASHIPQVVLTVIFLFVLGLNTFLFSEWIFANGYLPFRTLIITIVGTFAWDVLIWVGFFSWLYQQNMLVRQSAFFIFVPFIIHAGAMWTAYVTRKRTLAGSVNTEGLV